jgi:hypothetical protein
MSEPRGYGSVEVEQRHLAEDVREVKSRITSIEASLHDMGLTMAKLTNQYVTVDALLKLQERVSALEALRYKGQGSLQALWIVFGVLITLGNLAAATKGKLW